MIEIKCKLFLSNKEINESTFSRLWKMFDLPFFSTKKLGNTEKAKIEYNAQDFEEAFDILKNDVFLFLKGDGYWGLCGTDNCGITFLTFVFKRKIVDDLFLNGIFNWVIELNKFCPVIYGFVCSKAEYEKKHLEVLVKDNGFSSTGTLGDSNRNFMNFLPGLYWFNFFGKELKDSLNIVSLLDTDSIEIVQNGDSGFAFHLKSDIVVADLNHRLTEELIIADKLGRNHFFDRTLKGEEFKHPIKFEKYLKNLRLDD